MRALRPFANVDRACNCVIIYMSGPTGTVASRRYGGKRMNNNMVDIISFALALALILSILWVLGLLPTLVNGILFPFFN